MSFSQIELEEHCNQILKQRRIKNKIVVLCEGKIQDNQGTKSPQAYKRMEQMPDANFYDACVPLWWKDKPRPKFFNCGDRKDAIDTYSHLIKLPENESYLNKEKLFALVDLDIQLHKINDYHFSDTEQIFCNLYQSTQVIEEQATKHRIWTTGLIHKEAYFIAPEIQEVFDDPLLLLSPQFKNNPAQLKDIYLELAQNISNDNDLQNNFKRVIKRIEYCNNLDCSQINNLQNTWNNQFNNCINTTNKERYRELVFALLTIRKAKEYWKQIEPNNDWTRSPKIFREQLSLKIGRFYAEQECDCKNHIPYFFKTLYQFA